MLIYSFFSLLHNTDVLSHVYIDKCAYAYPTHPFSNPHAQNIHRIVSMDMPHLYLCILFGWRFVFVYGSLIYLYTRALYRYILYICIHLCICIYTDTYIYTHVHMCSYIYEHIYGLYIPLSYKCRKIFYQKDIS